MALRTLAAFLWLIVFLVKTPALLRLLANRSRDRDPQRVLVWFIASSQIYSALVGITMSPRITGPMEAFIRGGNQTLVCLCALGALWIAWVYRAD